MFRSRSLGSSECFTSFWDLSKLFNQLNNYLNTNGYLDNFQFHFQSGFQLHRSTETALIKIIHDICLNIDSGKISALVILDLSAVFDTVDCHNILLERLENWVWLSGMVLKSRSGHP